MMDALSERLAAAVEFLKRNGYAKSGRDVAHRLGVTESTICMAMKGTRTPSWELLLNFCDAYPIDFAWMRTGEGAMIKGERETDLLKRIEELERTIEKMKG